MNRKRIFSLLMAWFLICSLLPAAVFAEEQDGTLGGTLKIKGPVALGATLSADYGKVTPAGITDEDVSFLWSRDMGEGQENVELGREKTYQPVEEDVGYKIILTITGLEEKGFTGTLTAKSYETASTQEEAQILEDLLAAQEAASGEESAQGEESVQDEASEPGSQTETEVSEDMQEVPAESEKQPNPEDAGENIYPEEDMYLGESLPQEEGQGSGMMQEEPAGEGASDEDDENWGEIYEDFPEISPADLSEEDSGMSSVSGEETQYDQENSEEESEESEEWSPEPGLIDEQYVEEVFFPADAQEDTEGTLGAEVQTGSVAEDGVTPVVDFGSVVLGTEDTVESKSVTVTNTGTGELNFLSVSPEHFMVQDFEEPLQAGMDQSLWIVPRSGSLEIGSYADEITYTSEEGISVTFIAKVNVVAADEEPSGNAGSGENEPSPAPKLTSEQTVVVFEIKAGEEVSALPVTVTNHTEAEAAIIYAGEGLYIQPPADNEGAVAAAGASITFTVLPLPDAQSGAYQESYTAVFQISGDETATVSVPVTVTMAEPEPEVVRSLKADPPEQIFDAVTEGYEQPDAKAFVLTNDGNTDLILTAPVSNSEESVFEVSGYAELPDNLLAWGGQTSFTVRPKTGLAAGKYAETFSVCESGTDGVNALAFVQVSFEVKEPEPVYSIAVDPSSITFKNREEGYTDVPKAAAVTVTNTGTGILELQQPAAENFEVGALGSVSIAPGETSEFAVQPKAGLPQGKYVEKIDILTDRGTGASVQVSFTVTEKVVKLVQIQNPADITGLANAVEKSASGFGLPAAVVAVTTNGNLKANVVWDVAACTYDRTAVEAQTFTVQGQVALPDGIANPDKIPLAAAVKVSVNAYVPKLASRDDNKITGISSDGDYDTQSRISFTAVGAGMDNTSPRRGDTRYLPLYWKVINTNSWENAPYTATFGMARSGDYTLSVVFNEQKYDGSKWANTGTQDTRSVDFHVAAADVTGVPGQTLTPAANAHLTLTPAANQRRAVQTGDTTMILPFVIALVAAAACVAGILIYRRKRK